MTDIQTDRQTGPTYWVSSPETKKGFKSNIATCLILLELLVQEFMMGRTQLVTCLIWPSLHCLIHFSKFYYRAGYELISLELLVPETPFWGFRICFTKRWYYCQAQPKAQTKASAVGWYGFTSFNPTTCPPTQTNMKETKKSKKKKTKIVCLYE